jgi:hypothetical protein
MALLLYGYEVFIMGSVAAALFASLYELAIP